ncbi:MAG TPA: hypothetical protein VIH59_29335 [Candidatus Tectomicrobia bacterium]|jgi:hypothetical protein
MITEKRERHATDRPEHGVWAIVARLRLPDGWLHLCSVVTHSPLLLSCGVLEHTMTQVNPLVTVACLVG